MESYYFALSEVGEGGGFGFEGGDGVDEAGDGEGVADAALAEDEAEDATFASQLDGDAHQGGDAGAVDLRDVIENDDNFAGAFIDYGLQGFVKLFAGFADGEAAVDVEDRDGPAGASCNFHGGMIHRGDSPSGG